MNYFLLSCRRLLRALVALLATLYLSSCNRYEFTVNENVVYSPAPLFTDFETADANLKSCIDQTIRDQHHTAASQLTRLNCSNAGIKSISGLAAFTALRELNLSHNQLTEISDLQFLSQLKVALLDHNQLHNVAELLLLTQLQTVHLDANPGLQCGDIWQLQRNLDAEITLPAHCEGSQEPAGASEQTSTQ